MDQKELKDDDRPKKFTLNETCILLSIMGLSFLNGMSSTIIQKITMETVEFGDLRETSFYRDLCYTVIPVPGIIAFAFLSEFTGRKPVYIALSAMSVLTATLECVPPFGKGFLVASAVQATTKGGLVLMNMLCIPEYCRPKHRFLCLVVSQLVSILGDMVASSCLSASIRCEMYFGIVGIVLGLACLGCACFWPESPYWMAVRGRSGDAAVTLRRLRGECAEVSQFSERRTPGSIKKIILALFCMLALASVGVPLNSLQHILLILRYQLFHNFEIDQLIIFVSSSCLLVLLSILSYVVKRKTIYLPSAIAALVSGYFLVVWLFVESLPRDPFFHIYTCLCQVLFTGLEVLSYIWATEIIPQVKYNTLLACIFCIVMYLSYAFAMILLSALEEFYTDRPIRIIILTTMTVPGLLIGLFFTKEIKGKTLFEIEESYLPESTGIPKEANDETVEIQKSYLPETSEISEETNYKKHDVQKLGNVLPETTASPEQGQMSQNATTFTNVLYPNIRNIH